MAKKKHRRTKNSSNIGLNFILGIGLFLVSLTAFLLLQGPHNHDESQPASSSVTPMEVNYPAPELSLQNVNGNVESLTGYRDKVVLVNNWAVWCPPCKVEIPTLQAYYESHSAEGFVIIGIEAGEVQRDVLAFVQEHGMTYPVWFDLTNTATNAFCNESLPSSYCDRSQRHCSVGLGW